MYVTEDPFYFILHVPLPGVEYPEITFQANSKTRTLGIFHVWICRQCSSFVAVSGSSSKIRLCHIEVKVSAAIVSSLWNVNPDLQEQSVGVHAFGDSSDLSI